MALNIANIDINTVLAVVGVILLILGLAKMGKSKKQGHTFLWIGVAMVLLFALPVFLGVSLLSGFGTQTAPPPASIPSFGSSGSDGQCAQNPVINPIFTDAYTKGSVTSTISQSKDSLSGNLLGGISVSSGVMTPSLSGGQKVITLVNASGYIGKIQPEYTVKCGAQNIQGNLDAFQNQTISLYSTSGLGNIGGTLGATGNDSISAGTTNNKVRLTGNTLKSAGRLFVIYEVNSTRNIQTTALNPIGGAPAPTPVTSVPNCYSNVLSGTPYKMAWEIPASAVANGAISEYNLQTVANSLDGGLVKGRAVVTIYNEQDAFDSATGNALTSGICDSQNRFYGIGGTLANGIPASSSTPIGQQNSWYFL